jgi:hypothetical protein
MFRKTLPSLVVSIAAVATGHAQTEFLGLPVSAYLDNISDSAALQRGATYVPLAAMGAMTDDERFWTKRRISLSYAFHDTRFDTSDAETHAGVAELFLESRHGQALNLAFSYANVTEENGFGIAEADSTGVAGELAQELLRFLCPDQRASQLWAGFSAGYGSIETELNTPLGSGRFEHDAHHFGPNLVFAQGITDRLTALVIPAYTMEWVDTDFGDSEGSLFTLTGRADFGVTDNVILTGFATWKQETHKEIDRVPSAFVNCEEWAEFGGSVRVSFTEDIGVRVGYSYETLHPNFDRHKFAARLELGF